MGLIVFIVIACLELVIMDLKLMNFTYWDVDRSILLFLLKVQIIHLVPHIFGKYLVVGVLYTFLKYGVNFMIISLRGYVMLYPNYENFASFSTNHAEAGTHIHLTEGSKPNDIFGVPLMEEDLVLSELPGGSMPKYADLPILDLLGNVVSKEELIQRGKALHSEVSLCPPNNELTFDPQDILCFDDEKRETVINETDVRKEHRKKMSEAINLILNHTLDDNGTKIEPEKLLKIVVELYNSSATAVTDVPSSTPIQSLPTETNMKL